jgi:hypothetical protein
MQATMAHLQSTALLLLCLLTFTIGSVNDGLQYLRDASTANISHGVVLGRLASSAFTEAFGQIGSSNSEHWSAEQIGSLEESFVQCGQLFLQLNKVADAADTFETAIRFQETGLLRQSLGDVRLRQWLLTSASDNYQMALQLGTPEEASLYKSMAVVSTIHGNFSGAGHWLRSAAAAAAKSQKQTTLRELALSKFLITGTVQVQLTPLLSYEVDLTLSPPVMHQAMSPLLIRKAVQDFDMHMKVGMDLFWMGAYSSSQVHTLAPRYIL